MRLIISLTIGLLFLSFSSANYVCENCICTNRDYNIGLKKVTFFLYQYVKIFPKGAKAPFCVHFVQDNVTSTATKASFAINVDDFSAVVINKGTYFVVHIKYLFSSRTICLP